MTSTANSCYQHGKRVYTYIKTAADNQAAAKLASFATCLVRALSGGDEAVNETRVNVRLDQCRSGFFFLHMAPFKSGRQ